VLCLVVNAEDGAQPGLVILLFCRVAGDLESADKDAVRTTGDGGAVSKGWLLEVVHVVVSVLMTRDVVKRGDGTGDLDFSIGAAVLGAGEEDAKEVSEATTG
jgi:hypothetical protein